MYLLTTPLIAVKGIGPKLSEVFAERSITTVKDLLLFMPLRYEDRSQKKNISDLVVDELVTLEVEVTRSSNFYKGRRSIQSATVQDETGKLKLMWFNNPHIVQRLATGTKLFISGKLTARGMMVQPAIEAVSDDTIHTGRLVPIYSSIPEIAPATLRKILKHILDHLFPIEDTLKSILSDSPELTKALRHMHFPDSEDAVITARERLALEELLSLIEHSQQLKKEWSEGGEANIISPPAETIAKLPFALTAAQQRCIKEITSDLKRNIPMNRLLIGDVGSGKTAVAGIACEAVLQAGHNAALVAPTQILAEQHLATFQKLFPHLQTKLITSKSSFQKNENQPTLYIGTHAVLNQLEHIKPALLIYDEQHRFGVRHRSLAHTLRPRPHLLTLSATPIPRTLMLSIFSHLGLSVIDEMPPGRQEVKTWLVPAKKKHDGLKWIARQIVEAPANTPQQALIICPFIDPSNAVALENVASATQRFEEIKTFYKDQQLRLSLLHGRMSKKEQAEITTKLYKKEIDMLVTTPIVEVGVDLPAASIIVIEAAERFGLASLHQLRGRVGRAGQAAYCLLFTSSSKNESSKRLKKFCSIHNGMELAELDLQNRGAGDIFGTQQHGFDELQFANWTNLDLITKAKKLADRIQEKEIAWKPFLPIHQSKTGTPLAN